MYSLLLNKEEMKTLAWLADRGYFPGTLYDAMSMKEDKETEYENGEAVEWEIPEHAAWSLSDLREDDPGAYLACLGGELLEKILTLENQIV